MKRELVEAEILCLSAEILIGKATEGEIKRVTLLAKENCCFDILRREFTSVHNTLQRLATAEKQE